MPFRLLGLTAHPDQAGHLCGRAFARYSRGGTHTTLVCVTGHGYASGAARSIGRRLGLTDIVLLDYKSGEAEAIDLANVFTDLMSSLRPHVVVADRAQPVVWEAAHAAFERVRRQGGGSAALPAKLYYRPGADGNAIPVTAAVATSQPEAPELFVRAFPSPWVTGVLERDLFAGVPLNPVGALDLGDRLAS